MIIRQMALGPIQANCFILGCEELRQAVVIDPGDEPDRILTTLAGDQLTVAYIINTHGHFDHVGANKRLKDVVIGAALSAIRSKDNVFRSDYERLIHSGMLPSNARHAVARKMLTVMWGMWKSNTAFNPSFV